MDKGAEVQICIHYSIIGKGVMATNIKERCLPDSEGSQRSCVLI